MAQRVCPYWVGYFLLNPLRRLFQNPDKILSPFVTCGMTVLDIGPGMGFFSLPLAEIVGRDGKVICIDIQEKMLAALERRAQDAHLAERLVIRLGTPTSLGLDDFQGRVDFALAFAVVHEVPDIPGLFAEVFQVLKPGAHCLVAEPKFHVTMKKFERSLAMAKQQGFSMVESPRIAWSHTALLRKD